jgi:hypothetical protein
MTARTTDDRSSDHPRDRAGLAPREARQLFRGGGW